MRLLFIAPNVPLHDRNSGDFRLFSLLKTLSITNTITFLAQRRVCTGPSEDDRYASELSDLGIEVHVQDYSIINILRTQKFQAAVLEFYFLAEHYLPRIRLVQPSCPVIIDTVDVHYARLLSKYQTTEDEQDLRESEETCLRELDIYSKADKVIAITEEDARLLLRARPQLDVAIIPNIHSPVARSGIQDKNRLIFVGGFGHDPNTDAVLYFCKDILPLIRSKIPDVRLTIAGSEPPQQIRDLCNDHVTVTGYVPSTTPYLQGSYISIAPLRYGAGMKGKIGEAMAHGLPVVTTPVGAEGMGLRPRENAMIADSPEEFADAVIELMQNEALYTDVSRNAVRHISDNYTAEIVGRKFGNILGEIIKRPVKKISLQEKAGIVLSHTLYRIRNKFVNTQHS